MTREHDTAVDEIAYAEAVRALSEQHSIIDSFRTRAGLLLSSAAVTTSFLAAPALRGGETNAFAWLALLAFGSVAALSLAILWPRRWDLTARSGKLIDLLSGESQQQVTSTELYRILRSHLDQSHDENQASLENLGLLFELGSSLLAIEVALWTASLAIGP